MLDGLGKIFRRSDERAIDGDKPRDAYMDVLKQIQTPQTVRRRPLLERAAAVLSRGRRRD